LPLADGCVGKQVLLAQGLDRIGAPALAGKAMIPMSFGNDF